MPGPGSIQLPFIQYIKCEKGLHFSENLLNILPWVAGVAQLVERLICNQRVGGSNPFASF